MLQNKAGKSVFNDTDVQVVTKSMLDGILFEVAQQYVVSLVASHPTVSNKNRIRIIKNVKSTKSYLALLSLINNTITAFNRVKNGGK